MRNSGNFSYALFCKKRAEQKENANTELAELPTHKSKRVLHNNFYLFRLESQRMPALGIFFASVFFLIWDASRCLMYDIRLSDAIGNLTVSLVVLIFNHFISQSRTILIQGSGVYSFQLPRSLVSTTRISKGFFSKLSSHQPHRPPPRDGIALFNLACNV